MELRGSIRSELLMRPVTGLLGIIAILMGLWTGPFFHIHMEGGSHSDDHLSTIHSHLEGWEPDHASSKPTIEQDPHDHHGVGVTVLAASGRKAQVMVAEVQSSKVIFEPAILIGHEIVVTVRAHDPPARRSSNPRSPPA